jgi:hypothetical protein
MMLWPGKQLDSLQSNPHKLLSTIAYCVGIKSKHGQLRIIHVVVNLLDAVARNAPHFRLQAWPPSSAGRIEKIVPNHVEFYDQS